MDIYIFVAPDGLDSAPGTKEQPVATLERARELAREKKNEGDVTVYLRGGRYFRRQSFVLGEEDAALKGRTVRYCAYPGETVYLDGGVVVDEERIQRTTDRNILDRVIEKEAREHLYEADLSGLGIVFGEYGNRGFRRPSRPAPNELFIDTKEMRLARYPKEGKPLIPIKEVLDTGSVPYDKDYSLRPAVFRYELERVDLWREAEESYVSGLFRYAWADDTIKIGKIDTEAKTITTEMPHLFGFEAQPHASWRILNLLEEIGEPGEYFIDTKAEKAYFYPQKDINGALIQVSVLAEPMLVLENTSGIRFENLILENARGTGAYIEGGSGNQIKNCTFRNLGTVAVQIGKGSTALPDGLHTAHGEYAPQCPRPKLESRIIGNFSEYIYEFAAANNNGGTNNGITGCDIYQIGAGGVLLSGGDRKTLTPAGNYVESCRITEVNRLEEHYKSGVNIFGVGNRISHCDMFGMPGHAIIIHGNDHVIEYNKIHDVIKHIADAGAIYMGRDVSEVGNVIKHNFIYDLAAALDNSGSGICAVYFDDFAVYNEIYGNYFYNIVQHGSVQFSTIFWNGGGETSIGNNVFIDCIPGVNPNISSNSYEVMHKEGDIVALRCSVKDPDDMRGVDITSPVYREKYPYLYDAYVNNVQQNTKYWNNVIIQGNDTEFVDAKHMDFTFKDDSASVLYLKAEHVTDLVHGIRDKNLKFEPIDFRAIGLLGPVGAQTL